MADLTRFDFHALRFNKSEAVQSMTAEEVGQYILLLVEAWLMGKDASLPDDLALLARLARVRTVSDKVLAQFPVEETDFGPRRRNPTLYSEWAVAKERTAVASKSGRLGSKSRWGVDEEPIATLLPSHRDPNGKSIAHTNPYQPSPVQTNPNQTEPSFKTIRIRYFSFFGKTQSDSKKCKQDYYSACSKYGEETVLKYFEDWAPNSKSWIREGYRGNDGLQFFYRKLDEMVEGDEIRIARENEEKKKNGPEFSDDELEGVMNAARVARDKLVAEDLERIRKQKEFEEMNRDAI